MNNKVFAHYGLPKPVTCSLFVALNQHSTRRIHDTIKIYNWDSLMDALYKLVNFVRFHLEKLSYLISCVGKKNRFVA